MPFLQGASPNELCSSRRTAARYRFGHQGPMVDALAAAVPFPSDCLATAQDQPPREVERSGGRL